MDLASRDQIRQTDAIGHVSNLDRCRFLMLFFQKIVRRIIIYLVLVANQKTIAEVNERTSILL